MKRSFHFINRASDNIVGHGEITVRLWGESIQLPTDYCNNNFMWQETVKIMTQWACCLSLLAAPSYIGMRRVTGWQVWNTSVFLYAVGGVCEGGYLQSNVFTLLVAYFYGVAYKAAYSHDWYTWQTRSLVDICHVAGRVRFYDYWPLICFAPTVGPCDTSTRSYRRLFTYKVRSITNVFHISYGKSMKICLAVCTIKNYFRVDQMP